MLLLIDNSINVWEDEVKTQHTREGERRGRGQKYKSRSEEIVQKYTCHKHEDKMIYQGWMKGGEGKF